MKLEDHRCEDTSVEAWIGRHFEPKEYAVANSPLHPTRAPLQARVVARTIKKDLNDIAERRIVRLRFGTSILNRAMESTGLLLDDIQRWLSNGGPQNIKLEDLEIMDFLQSTRGPAGLIEEVRWLPEVQNVVNRRKMAYLSWLLDVPEALLKEWGLETSSDVEFATFGQYRGFYDEFANNSGAKTIIYGTGHEPSHGAPLKRHTRDRLTLNVRYGERYKACLVPEGVILHWRNMPNMLTRWDDVLSNNRGESNG